MLKIRLSPRVSHLNTVLSLLDPFICFVDLMIYAKFNLSTSLPRIGLQHFRFFVIVLAHYLRSYL
ncbi:hypothetical protein CW304_32215 [Bacillus sp. UFRGS-B20]|nr:hypothetical protein CW304_32215 [Bacillus sp. UFRGS-B20]